MDWSNERYVRLYIRDTTTWKRMGWDGQCMLMHLLRKVDRAGSLELDGLDPWEAAMLHTGAPEQVARQGTDALLRTGTIEARGDLLVFPHYIEAQECSKSDAQRAREYREKRSLGSVTNSDAMESQIVTQPSQVERERHERERTRHSSSLRTVLCSAVQSRAGGLGDGADAPTAPASPQPPKPSATRKPPAAQQALGAALKRAMAVPPQLSRSLREKAAKRLTDAVAAGVAPDLDTAADVLVAAWQKLDTSNAWKLCDVPISAPKPKPSYPRLEDNCDIFREPTNG